MNILEDFDIINEDSFDCVRYEKVIFKDDFFIMLKRLIDETHNGKLSFFQQEMTSDEVIELLKKVQSQQLSATSQCHALLNKEYLYIAIEVYKEFIKKYNQDTYQYDILSDPEYIYIYFNLTNPNKPFVYLKTN